MCLLTGDQRRARTKERIKHYAVAHAGVLDRICHKRHWLHGRMILARLRTVIFPDGGLLPVGIPLVLPALLPSEQTRLMLPLVWASSKDQCVLLPDTATRKIESCILECLSEIQPLRIRMEYINGSILFH